MKKTVALLTAAIAVCGLANQAKAAEERFFTPFLSISEEYTDNVFDTKDNKRTDYITRLRPGFTSNYQAPRWRWDLAYNLDYRYYARDSESNDLSHDAGLKGTITLLENFFFLDLSDSYKRVSLDVVRDSTVSSTVANQTDQNIATINPWLLWRPGQKTTLKTGYRFTDTRYWKSDGIDKQAHSGYADATYELTAKLNLLAAYTFTHQKTAENLDYDKHDASVGFKYSYADKSYIQASGGYTWQDFSDNRTANYQFWNASLVHDFSLLVATLETRRQTTEDPLADATRETSYLAKLDRAFERGAIGLSGGYTEYDNNGITATGRRKSTIGMTGRYEIINGVLVSAALAGERYSYDTPALDEYPYRLTGNAGLTWQMMKALTLSLNYTHISNQYDLDSTAGGWTTNRAVLDLKMVF